MSTWLFSVHPGHRDQPSLLGLDVHSDAVQTEYGSTSARLKCQQRVTVVLLLLLASSALLVLTPVVDLLLVLLALSGVVAETTDC